MIEKMQDYLLGLLKPKHPIVHAVDGHNYAVRADGTLGELVRKPAPIAKPTLDVSTLTGFVDAYRVRIDEFPAEHAIHVVDHRTVELKSMHGDEFGRRHVWLSATCAEVSLFPFGEFITPEKFIMGLHDGFLCTEDILKLQRLASSLSADNSVATSDDGLSQKVTVNLGAVSKQSIDLPTRIPLAPYRTFREVDPCFNEFMVRLRGAKDSVPAIALIEVSGGKWKSDTVLQVAQWLRRELKDVPVIA